MGIQILHLKMHLDPDDAGMGYHSLGVLQRVAVIGVVGREAVQVGESFEKLDIPFVHRLRDAFFVCVIGKNDGTDTPFVQIFDTLPTVILVQDIHPRGGEEGPDGIEPLVRKEMNVEIDDR